MTRTIPAYALTSSLALLGATASLAAPPASTVQLSAQYESMQPSFDGKLESLSGKLWVSQKMIRSETLDEGHVMALINDPTRKTILLVVPDQGFYQDVSKRFYHPPKPSGDLPPGMIVITHDLVPGAVGDLFVNPKNPCAEMRSVTCAATGTDSVDGRMCDRWKFTSPDGKNWSECVDQKLGLRISGTKGAATYKIFNIKEGEQHTKLFKVPSDLQKTDSGEDFADKLMAPPKN